MTVTQTIDEAKVEAFVGRALGDLGGAMTSLFCALGDRLGCSRRSSPVRRRARSWPRGSACRSATCANGCAA
jgi:hypothetical protein